MPKKDFDDKFLSLLQKSGWGITEVVCGMARGADTWGRMWAEENGIPVKKFPAEWNKFGRAAGPIRNSQMAEYADSLIVFIYSGSRGSKNMLDTMAKLKKPYTVCYAPQG